MKDKQLWKSKYIFPRVIGVFDCTHVGILKPNSIGAEYINRKGKPHFNVQATCNATEMFTSVDPRLHESLDDSRIWKN